MICHKITYNGRYDVRNRTKQTKLIFFTLVRVLSQPSDIRCIFRTLVVCMWILGGLNYLSHIFFYQLTERFLLLFS